MLLAGHIYAPMLPTRDIWQIAAASENGTSSPTMNPLGSLQVVTKFITVAFRIAVVGQGCVGLTLKFSTRGQLCACLCISPRALHPATYKSSL